VVLGTARITWTSKLTWTKDEHGFRVHGLKININIKIKMNMDMNKNITST
jgi:hypothetical protein